MFPQLIRTDKITFNRERSVYMLIITGETVSTLRGQSVVLTCPIDITSCGDLHSVKWFKGNDRVAVVSGDGDVSNVEGQYTERGVKPL
ncbi:hypothetical protein Bhyg_04636 [Pseudolycoriella hygida]|uniref:BIG2 domain-containing protein n=1 Tax=Pseudolycoriella hygida TaxID=35572 RepID=A0A9Q0S8M7_9DIPT|nr:hypothetical protein Bhyg_04636 [Pseudolycoriella hygida]